MGSIVLLGCFAPVLDMFQISTFCLGKDLGPRCGSTVIWIYLLVGPWFCGVVCKPETPWAELDRLS